MVASSSCEVAAPAPAPSLDALPARPPTPPRERQQTDTDIRPNRSLASHLNLQTPPSHSPNSDLSTRPGSTRTRKKVEFTVHAEYRDPPTYTDKENAHKQSTPVSASSSAGVERPLKSILKPTASPNPPNPLDPSSATPGDAGRTLATMLESAIRQLAGIDRDNKVDAYTTLVRALKTSNNLPDRIALQAKMSLFTQFIQRDVTAKATVTGIDASLVNHALTLLSTFLHFPAIASSISPDFGVFIIDHSIRSFEDPSTPKDVVRHLMQVVALQDFSLKVMSAERVGRLISSLHTIENNIKGKSIIMSRILIYRRLIRQTKNHMVTHADWLLDLFTDMLSTIKEIRAAAIALGMEASFSVAREKQLQKKVMDILQITADETRYVEFYMQRLILMTKEKADMASVPQIWSVVILLLRCPLDKWEFYNPWLGIIQRSFNSGDIHTKIEANHAWNRLVYALHLYDTSFSKTIGTLCQPFVSQLRRKGKTVDEYRKVVLGSLCNLYYYAFRPNSSATNLETYWDTCVLTLIRTLAFPESTTKLTDAAEKLQFQSTETIAQATVILNGLFDSSTGRLWNEDRINENALVKPDELPALDPKWIRRNSSRIFAVVEPIFLKAVLDLADPKSNVSRLWDSVVSAVATAASKEVKVSTDTAAFLGQALSSFMTLWSSALGKTASPALGAEKSFLQAVENYLGTMISKLGPLPFTEKLLTMSKQNVLIPIATPSHRQGKGYGVTRSPIHHLFSILSTLPPGVSDEESFSRLVQTTFGPFVPTRSPRAKRDFVLELMQLLPPDGPAPYGPWVFIAQVLSTSSEFSQSSHSSSDSSSQPPVGHEFREMVKHLERGISATPNLPWDKWLTLFTHVATQATELSGEAGCSVAVVESLAKNILENFPSTAFSIGSNLLQSGVCLVSLAKQPRDRQALDAARRRLWGTSVAGSRSASFDPFEFLYRFAVRLLEISYTNLDQIDESNVVSLLKEVSQFLSRSSNGLVFKSLVQLQHGVGLWIQDAEGRFSSKNRSALDEAVGELWDRICNLFVETTLEPPQLDAIEELLCSAFKSKHRGIVNNAVLLWNRAFEYADSIEYPVSLKEALLSIRQYVDVVLPGLDSSICDSRAPEPSFVESQDDVSLPPHPIKSSLRVSAHVEDSSSKHSTTPMSDYTAMQGRRKTETIRSKSHPKSAKRSRTPRLRHDDSQIQFAAIDEPSPSNRAAESQALTDRQKEVRDRQSANAVLYPSIRSSPRLQKGRSSNESVHPSPQLPTGTNTPVADNNERATPKANRTYDYVSSTPTPRRGHASLIEEDHEMTDDIPSSPPEPRRNLLPEMQSHSRSNSILADIPISSSPISGSPVTKASRRARGENQASQGGNVDSINDPVPDLDAPPAPGLPFIVLSHEKEQAETPGQTTFAQLQPLTTLRPPKRQETPKSDNDVYTDALTSPAQQARDDALPDRLKEDEGAVDHRGDVSFELSDGEERSMARLVIELDSRKCEPLPNYESPSPEKAELKEPALDCITVDTGSGSGDDQKRPSKSRRLPSSSIASSSPLEAGDSQSPGRRARNKRKRVGDKRQQNSGKRRRRSGTEERGSVKNSPMSQATQQALGADVEMRESEAGENAGTVASDKEVNVSRASPDLGHDFSQRSPTESSELDEDGSMAAIRLQLITEASQQSQQTEAMPNEQHGALDGGMYKLAHESEQGDGNLEQDDQHESKTVETRVATREPSAMERIMASLQSGLEGLRTATLSREEVYRIEDMFMDIKKELYSAEGRSRR